MSLYGFTGVVNVPLDDPPWFTHTPSFCLVYSLKSDFLITSLSPTAHNCHLVLSTCRQYIYGYRVAEYITTYICVSDIAKYAIVIGAPPKLFTTFITCWYCKSILILYPIDIIYDFISASPVIAAVGRAVINPFCATLLETFAQIWRISESRTICPLCAVSLCQVSSFCISSCVSAFCGRCELNSPSVKIL